MDRLFQTPYVDLTISDSVRRSLFREPARSSTGSLIYDAAFRMRIFPRREIVSDAVRYAQLPFCGMKPFMDLVDRIASAAASAAPGSAYLPEGRAFTFAEGGPHLGDCTLFASAALEAAGLPAFAAGYEPLPDASDLFRDSVRANGWDGMVTVVPRALAASSGEKVTMAYFPGHNGEGTTVRASSEAHCGSLCAGFEQIPTVTLDASWPALRPAAMDVLKLSVNGEELNTLRGARSLLSRRMVCSTLVHVSKAQRGWADQAGAGAGDSLEGAAPASAAADEVAETTGFATELWGLLSEQAGMEVSLHLSGDLTSQVKQEDQRPRPSTRRLRSAAELDEVFRRPASAHDYLIARQVDPEESEPCAGSLALRHWNEVF